MDPELKMRLEVELALGIEGVFTALDEFCALREVSADVVIETLKEWGLGDLAEDYSTWVSESWDPATFELGTHRE